MGATIINSEELAKLRRIKKIWWVGWMVSLFLLLCLGFSISLIYSHHESLKDIEKVKEKVQSIQLEQKQINENYVKAWENQQITADLLVTWGSYVKEKSEIIKNNNLMVKK